MITTDSPVEALNEPLLSCVNQDEGTSATRRRIRCRSRSKFATFCIITPVVLERLAYYSLLGNLVVYTSTVLHWSSEATLATSLTFTGCTWLSCLLGGYFGDVVFGRMNTIAMGLIIYFIGFLCLPFLSWVVQGDDQDGKYPLNVLWFILALFFISMGEGCFKSNMSPFGADQQSKHEDKSRTENFFSYYYWAINLGSLLGYGPVVFLQDQKNFIYGYSVPAGLLLVALLVFLLPRTSGYTVNKPAPNITVKVYKILKEAWGRRKEAKAHGVIR